MHEFEVVFFVPIGLSDEEVIETLKPSLYKTASSDNEGVIDVTDIFNETWNQYVSRGWQAIDAEIDKHGYYKTMTTREELAKRLRVIQRDGNYVFRGNSDKICTEWVITEGIRHVSTSDMLADIKTCLSGDVDAMGTIGAFVDTDGTVSVDYKRNWESLPCVLMMWFSSYLSSREQLLLEYDIDRKDQEARDEMLQRLADACRRHADDMECIILTALG